MVFSINIHYPVEHYPKGLCPMKMKLKTLLTLCLAFLMLCCISVTSYAEEDSEVQPLCDFLDSEEFQ